MLSRAEQQYLHILSDFVNNLDTSSDTNLTQEEWDQIYKISKIQRTQAVLWKQCKDILSVQAPKLYKRFHRAFLNDIFQSVYYREDLKEVDGLLSGAGIRYSLMKGAVINQYYSEPMLRTMSDIDVIISREDRDTIKALMTEAGYECIIPTEAEYVYNRDKIEYEFHDRMISEPLSSDFDYEFYFQNVWNHTRQSKNMESTYQPLDNEFHFLFLFVHIAKHVLDAGMGIRSYMDLPIVAEALKEEMNWQLIRNELEKMDLLTFAGICETFCERWFGKGFPIDGVPITEEFYEQTTRNILNGGIYGHEDVRNRSGYAAKEIHKSNGSYWQTALRIVIRRIFPPYENMKLIPWYSFVNGRPYLLPVAWVYRWFYVMFHKRDTGTDVLLEVVKKRDIINERQEYYSGWGL